MSGNHLADFHSAIHAQLGNAPEHIEPGRTQRFGTNGKHGDTSGWSYFFDDGRAGVYGDFRSGVSLVWTATHRDDMTHAERSDLAQRIEQAKVKREADKVASWAVAADRLANTWGQSLPVAADGSGVDPVTLYLRRRLAVAPGAPLAVPDVLRVHPGLSYHHDGAFIGTWPAMVAAMQNPAGDLVALHRTWLTADGHKAPVPGPVKKVSPACGSLAGGCIRLAWTAADAPAALGIAEGIETALAARELSGLSTVSAYSSGAMERWQWSSGLRCLVIFADADPAGADAAEKLRHRARTAGLAVIVKAPSTPGNDWCNVLIQRGNVGTEGVKS